MAYLYLAIAIVGEVVGTAALKSTEEFTRLIPSLIVIVGYGMAFFFLTLALRTIPVGIAYAVWAGIGIVLISAAALGALQAGAGRAGDRRHRLDRHRRGGDQCLLIEHQPLGAAAVASTAAMSG